MLTFGKAENTSASVRLRQAIKVLHVVQKRLAGLLQTVSSSISRTFFLDTLFLWKQPLNAVKQWKNQPTALNGELVEQGLKSCPGP